MQDTMDDDAMEFLVIRMTELVGIGENGIERNDNITADGILLRIVERDDVGIVVVSQILVVHLQNLVVIDKKISPIFLPYDSATRWIQLDVSRFLIFGNLTPSASYEIINYFFFGR